jgi:glycosyltransferase involved in cell wall biosynthesis
MRIAVWHNLPSGGAKRALYYHVRGLVERGHVVEAWCPPTADRTYLPLADLIPEHVGPLEEVPAPAKGRFTEALGKYRHTVARIAALNRHCEQCAAQIKRGGFDLLFANTSLYIAAPAIGRYLDIPRVLYLQEPSRGLYEAAPELPWIARPSTGASRWSLRGIKHRVDDLVYTQQFRLLAREELENARAFDALLVNSYYSRESVLRAYGLDARVCYLGIDTRLFRDRDTPRESYLVGLSSFLPSKNIGLAIESVGTLPDPRPRLVWIGNLEAPGHLDRLRALAHSLQVEFEPRQRVEDAELIETLNRAAVMLYAPRLEPFGFAPLEANACGLPVVAVAEGGVRETILHGVNGLVVEPDKQAMAAAVRHLMHDRAVARRLGESGRDLVARKWSLEAAIDRLETRLQEVCSGPADSLSDGQATLPDGIPRETVGSHS